MGQFLPVAVSAEFPRKTDKMFSHVLSIAALASLAVAAPQYYYPGLSPTYYTTGIAQPAAIAAPAVAVPAVETPVVAPAGGLAALGQLGDLAALLPGLKALTAQATAQTPATLAALDQIQVATLNLLNKVPAETIPVELRADVGTLIAATQQLGALDRANKPLQRAELDKVIAASNNLLAKVPA